MNELDRVVVVIPAYEPGPPFVSVVGQLVQAGFRKILVVNDGSSPACASAFEAAVAAGAQLVTHVENRGKGQALKTAFAEVRSLFAGAAGVITCDADGQHLVPDVLAVARAFLRNQASLILGARHFDRRGVPLRSWFGNTLTGLVFRFLVGKRLTDTQTGLRAIPNHLLPSLAGLTTGKYDYELEMLIHALKRHVLIQEVPISTVYAEGNQSSHFNPVIDSVRIYFVFVRFVMASCLSAIIDFAVFSAAVALTSSVLGSMAVARLTAGMVNFAVGRRFTFKSQGTVALELTKYWLLVAFYLLVSYSMVRMLSDTLGTNVYLAKITAEAALFVFSFLVQRAYVFNTALVPTVPDVKDDQREPSTVHDAPTT